MGKVAKVAFLGEGGTCNVANKRNGYPEEASIAGQNRCPLSVYKNMSFYKGKLKEGKWEKEGKA